MSAESLAHRFTSRRASRRKNGTLKATGKEHSRELGERYSPPSTRGAQEGADLFDDPVDDEDDE